MAENTDRHELLHLVKELECRREHLPTQEPTCCPTFLCKKKERYQPIDWDTVPLIVNDSLLEIRPTNELKKMKNSGFKNDKIFVSINSPHNPYASPPWYHPCDPAFRKEQAVREMKREYIYPTNDLDNPCQIPSPDIGKQREITCSCSNENRNFDVCKWKEYDHEPCSERKDLYLCTKH